MRRGLVLPPVLALLAALLGSAPAPAREIVDMAGRRVEVPDDIRRIYVAHDPPAIFLTALAPDLMIGTPFPIRAPPTRCCLRR